MNKEVSVIMPVRNGGSWLHHSIPSILDQSYPHFQLIIIDDGSSDETPEIINRYSKMDSRIRTVRQEGLGLVPALNRGLEITSAPYVARMDADDIAMPHRLERQIQFLENHPEVGLLGTWAEKIDCNAKKLGELTPKTDIDYLIQLLPRTNPFVHPTMMFRTELLQKVGQYRRAVQTAEDYDMWLRISEVAGIALLPELLLKYRWHPQNVTNSQSVRQMFSARLGRRAAKFRRENKTDPLTQIPDQPPDWNSAEADNTFYFEDARLYRFIEMADPNLAAKKEKLLAELSDLWTNSIPLTHLERKTAQIGLLNYWKANTLGQRGSGIRLAWNIFRLHPGRAFQLALNQKKAG